MSKKVFTEAELELKDLQFELKEFERMVVKDLKEIALTRKLIQKDVEKAEKTVAKEKAAKGSK